MSRLLALVLACAAVLVTIEGFRFFASGPGRPGEQVVFEVPAHTSFHKVVEELKAKGLIQHSLEFRIFAKLTHLDKKVKRGEYLLNRSMTAEQILRVLISGKSILHKVTFPEGTNIYEMAHELDQRGFYKESDFLKACHDKVLIRQLLGIDVSSLEGYLFPETYEITKYTPLHELLGEMVKNFKNVYSELSSTAGNSVLSRHQVVTLASIVEKETGDPSERPIIASVFYNRLQKHMRLQSDPTILYGLWVQTGVYKADLTKADITHSTPYNTYTLSGLPFGPIANPGREALKAVLFPAHTEYLYFVSRNNGTHVFSKTYQEHERAVREFQLDPNARRGHSWRELSNKKAHP